MPGGISLGGATFQLYADNQQILTALAQARAATDTATKQMAAAQKLYAQAAQQSNAQIRAAFTQTADQLVASARVWQGTAEQIKKQMEAMGVTAQQTGKQMQVLGVGVKQLGATLATLTGFGAIASGALVAREAFLALYDATTKLEQAQFKLNKVYGAAGPLFADMGKQIAAQAGKSRADGLKMAGEFASLQRNYALTVGQVGQLMQLAADAAAVSGVSLEESAHRVEGALRGEAESAEFLGLALQSDFLKALQDANSWQRKYWETLSPVAKAQLILNEAVKQGGDYQGAAVDRVQTLDGAVEHLGAAFTDLATVLNKSAGPQLAAMANTLAAGLESLTGFIEGIQALQEAADALGTTDLTAWIESMPVTSSLINALWFEQEARAQAAAKQADQAVAKAAAKAAADAKAATAQAKADADTRAKIIADLEKKAREKAIEAENRMYESKREALEDDKRARIQAADDARDAALAAIDKEKQAWQDLYRERKRQIDDEKEAHLKAAEEKHRGAVRALEAEKDAVEQANKAQLRRIDDEKDAAVRAADDKQDAALKALEREVRARDAVRTQEDRALDDETERVKRAMADRHEAVVEGLEDDARAVRAAAERASRRVEGRSEEHTSELQSLRHL